MLMDLIKKEIKVSNKYLKKYLMSLAVREAQIKSILTFYVSPGRLDLIKKTSEVKCWPGGGSENCSGYHGDQQRGSSKGWIYSYFMTPCTTYGYVTEGRPHAATCL